MAPKLKSERWRPRNDSRAGIRAEAVVSAPSANLISTSPCPGQTPEMPVDGPMGMLKVADG